MVKDILRERKFHGKQASDERLYMRREEGVRGLKSFKDVYARTKVRVACNMAASTDEWIKAAWANECSKEHTSTKKIAEELMVEIKVDVEFGMGNISIGNETVDNWKTTWKILRMKLQQGLQQNKMERLSQKNMQSEIPRNQTKDDYGRLKCNTDPAKTVAVFSMQEQMVEKMAWKKMRGLNDNDQCRLCRKQKEKVQHLLAGWETLASTEYARRHNNPLKVIAIRRAINNGVLLPDTIWWNENWTKERVIQRNRYKLLWDWKHRMRTTNTARRPDLTLEDKSKKMIYIVDMVCPYESNIHEKRIEKLRKYQQLAFEMRERREQYRVTVVPLVVACLGGGIKQLTKDIKVLFKPEDVNSILSKMQKVRLWESETNIKESSIWTDTKCFVNSYQ